MKDKDVKLTSSSIPVPGDMWDDIDSLSAEDLEDIEDLDEVSVVSNPEGIYVSPLMAKLSTNRLTLAMLAEEIPLVQAGDVARKTLAEGVKGVRKIQELNKIVSAGEGAKERLFAATLPLIRTVAHREHRRRQQWGSQIGIEDLTQEAILGFFKGLSSFKPEAVRTSPTNYLGQWMLVGMRRSAEVMDHDLQVGHDAGERFRKVRAIRSRLIADLGREPTDQEISDASRNPAYLTRPGMVGKLPPKGENHPIGKGLSLSNIEEERDARSRLGHASRFGSADSEEGGESSPSSHLVDAERLVSADLGNLGLASDPAELAIEAASAKEVAKVVELVLDRMGLPDEQREIIARRFGLHPHDGEVSAREISRIMGIHRERITKVLSAFTAEMTRKGGVFHEVIANIPEDDLVAIGLNWVAVTLGEWDPAEKEDTHIPTVLTETMKVSIPLEDRASGKTKFVGTLAWFQCDYHDRIFSILYADLRSVPKARVCPVCQKPSVLVRTEAMGEESIRPGSSPKEPKGEPSKGRRSR